MAAVRPGRGIITQKNPTDVAAMREACFVVVAVHRRMLEAIASGITPVELDAIAAGVIQAAGGRASFLGHHGYPASTCVAVNDVIVHGIPGLVPLEDGDVISVDVGVDLHGFHGDAAWTYAVGDVNHATRKLMEGTKTALRHAVSVAHPGRSLGDIGAAIEETAATFGLSVVPDFGGHGIGRSLWEEPHLPNISAHAHPLTLRPGMALAIEPMLSSGSPAYHINEDGWTIRTRDGSRAAHYEHTVVVSDDGPPMILTEDLELMVH